MIQNFFSDLMKGALFGVICLLIASVAHDLYKLCSNKSSKTPIAENKDQEDKSASKDQSTYTVFTIMPASVEFIDETAELRKRSI